MIARWRAWEGPTWLVAAAVYGGWLALAAWHRAIPLALVWPAAIALVAWHSSLQHETIHALRRVPRPVRTLLATPPLGIWYPYEIYRIEHLRHHGTRDLAGPGDPESFALDPATWSRTGPVLRAILHANQTLAGRLVLGPAVQIARAYRAEVRHLRRRDRGRVLAWSRHLVLVAAVLAVAASCGVPPIVYVLGVAYPAASLALLRSFAEHRYVGTAAERTAIVESRGPLALLFLNNNLHAVHHRYPGLPWFALPERYRLERARDVASAAAPLRGYRTVVRRWFLRPIDAPVADSTRNSVPLPR